MIQISKESKSQSSMGEIHACHPNHKLYPKSYKKPYTCDGCKMPGVGPRYRCEECDYDLHQHCMFYKSTTHHDLFKNSIFKFFRRLSCEGHCNGCGKPVKGFLYHCEEKWLHLHPCCMNLPRKLKADDVIFVRHYEVLKKCFWCNKKKIEESVSGIRGWSYVSHCDKYHIHAHCATEMAIEGCKNHHEPNNNNNNNNINTDSLAVTLVNVELPIQIRRRSGTKFLKIVKLFFKAFVALFVGDTNSALTLLAAEIFAKR